ncbi:MAG: MATE family efflux transporter [Schaedlerella sp.]|nr:MATE family efflux transporter [Schaedlerella sp.]
MNKRQSSTDLTNGPIVKVLLLFTLPILFDSVLQQLYNIVDTAIIGNYLGDNALASVGASGPIYELFLGITMGFGNGFSVLIARYFGAKKENDFKKSVSWTYLFSFIIAILLTVTGLLGIRPLLNALNTPATIIEDTVCYMKIILAFSVVTMFYNMFAGMLRAVGNSRIPLFFLSISTTVNIILDIVFIRDFHLGIAGVAYATVFAQFISAILCVIYIYTKCPILRFDRKYLMKDNALTGNLLTTGLSMAMMYVVVSIGTIALQSSVNSFGEQTIAAHNTARKINNALMLPIGALNSAAATFTSQNFGARKIQRVKRGITSALTICSLWIVIAIAIAYLFGEQIIILLTGSQDPFLIDTAFRYIKINILFFHALGVLIILRSSLQGMGRKLIPLLGSVIELVFKFAAVGFIAPALGYFGICILEPVIWIVCAIVVLIDYFVFMRKYSTTNK